MTITFDSLLLFFAVLCFFIAALGLVPDFRFWRWFPGGAFLASIAMFVRIST